jgi:hypothetical protein
MRDPARIERILALLGELWKLNPELRLGQLVAVVTSIVRRWRPCSEIGDVIADPFYLDDAELEEILRDQLDVPK